jgi:hypothetical protein
MAERTVTCHLQWKEKLSAHDKDRYTCRLSVSVRGSHVEVLPPFEGTNFVKYVRELCIIL